MLSHEHISYTTGKKIEDTSSTSHDGLATVFGDMLILGRKIKNSQIVFFIKNSLNPISYLKLNIQPQIQS